MFFFLALTGFASETLEGAKKDFQTFKTEMTGRIESLEKQLSDLKAKAKENGKSVSEQTVEDLEKTRAQLRQQLEDMKFKGEKSFKKVKSRFAEALDSLNSGVQKALKDQ